MFAKALLKCPYFMNDGIGRLDRTRCGSDLQYGGKRIIDGGDIGYENLGMGFEPSYIFLSVFLAVGNDQIRLKLQYAFNRWIFCTSN